MLHYVQVSEHVYFLISVFPFFIDFFICMVKHCRMAEAGLVGRFALSLSLYYALPY